MKMTCFARPPKFWTRLAMMITGVTVQGFGLSLLIRLALGTDPVSYTHLTLPTIRTV